MRTTDEILNKAREWAKSDFFGFKTCDILEYLPFEDAKEFLKPETTEEQWGQPPENSREAILKKMEEYMAFAWDKANNARGISARRSMAHYTAWIWLLGDEAKFGDLEHYQFYGKDNLARICQEYGWDSSKWDDGERYN